MACEVAPLLQLLPCGAEDVRVTVLPAHKTGEPVTVMVGALVVEMVLTTTGLDAAVVQVPTTCRTV